MIEIYFTYFFTMLFIFCDIYVSLHFYKMFSDWFIFCFTKRQLYYITITIFVTQNLVKIPSYKWDCKQHTYYEQVFPEHSRCAS